MKVELKVSVLMASRNNFEYLSKSIESILSQSFSDFEYLILDDCSEEKCIDEVKKFKDDRIKLTTFKSRVGISDLLNYGISVSKGKYIARMDNDDISLADRLKLQVDFMENNKNIDVCGTRYFRIDEDDNIINLHNGKYTDDEIKIALLLGETSIHHPTAMIKKSSLVKAGIRYEPEFNSAEDFRLWCRCSYTMKLANLPVPLFKYRIHNKSTSVEFSDAQRLLARRILKQHLENLKIPISQNELECHYQYSLSRDEFIDDDFMQRIDLWHNKLKQFFYVHRSFDYDIFKCMLDEKYEKIVNKYKGQNADE